MWNSKRILLLGLGFAIFLVGYCVYAYFLGGIDGLPPLRADLLPGIGPGPGIDALPQVDAEVDRKLAIAFGAGSADINRTIKLEVRKKGLVIASDQMTIESDGRVKLTPLRLALFREEKADCQFPEVNTISSDNAWLTFDQPIANMTDIGTRKIVGAELKGGIVIINNRRTPQKSDDLEVRVDEQSLFYDERPNKVWTSGYVKLLDTATRPHPTDIRGKGLELYMAKDDPLGKSGKRAKPAVPKKNDNIGGVEQVVLLSSVEMHLYPEAGGFPGATKDDRPTPPAAKDGADSKGKKNERSHVVIRTQGRFVYDVTKDLATFDSPTVGGATAPEHVLVLREALHDAKHPGADPERAGQLDQLLCDHLELQFRRKNTDGTKTSDKHNTRSADREIDSALATARPGREVWLVMDSENLAANCTELNYYSSTPERGTTTRLKGSPLQAVKDGHKIKASELMLVGGNQKGSPQQLEAKGPGQVDLFDRASAAKSPDKSHPVHAFWKDTLTSTKDRVGDKLLDLLTFTGDAVFLDEEHDQELQGEKLMVWLEPNERASASGPKAAAGNRPQSSGGSGQRPHKVEAFGRVKARAPEMKIHLCEHLVVLFEEGADVLPDAVAAVTPTAHTVEKQSAGAVSKSAAVPSPESASGGAKAPPLPPGAADPAPVKDGAPPAVAPKADAPKPPAPDAEKKKPIQLWARDVTAYVVRSGAKNELRNLVTDGNVHVRQEGAKPDDKGVDIKGDRLKLRHQPAGDLLEVFSDGADKAELQLGEMLLIGPAVTIDQQKNLAYVEGSGAMSMPSKTTFDGSKPAKPGTMLKVHWKKDMLFNGKDADFTGDVVAYQDNAALQSQTLQVVLDRFVSFKEGQKGGQGAKAERMVAHGNVYIIDSTRDEKDSKLLKYQRLRARQVVGNNIDNRFLATGPGKVFALGLGAKEIGTGPESGKEKKVEEVMKLTRVDFQDQMTSYEKGNRTKTRISNFFGNVEVLHLEANNPDVEVDLDNLPRGAMYIQSAMLTVASTPRPGGKQTQEMTAKTRVFFRTQEFFGRAEVVKYNEAQDTVIFEGSPAILYRRKAGLQGREYDEIKGRQILYNRKTGKCIIDGATEIKMSRAGERAPARAPVETAWREESVALAGLDTHGQDHALAHAAADEQGGRQVRLARPGRLAEGQRHRPGGHVLVRLVARDDG